MDELTPPANPPEDHFHSPVNVIAQGDFGTVALCSCGHVHINLQYITLRFEPEAFGELVAMLGHAKHQLATDPRLRAMAAPQPDADSSPVH